MRPPSSTKNDKKKLGFKKLFILIMLFLAFPLSGECAMNSKPKKIKAVVFDFGGVIANQDKQELVSFLTESFELSKEELTPCLQDWKEILKSGGNEQAFWTNYATSIGKSLPGNWFSQFEEKRSFKEIPGMTELVKKLQEQGYQTPMLSNIDLYQANVVRKFKYYELFEPVLLSYEIGYEKPHKESFLILLKNLSLSSDQIIFIDDQKKNIDAARGLGIEAIHFSNLTQLINELEEKIDFFSKPAQKYTLTKETSMINPTDKNLQAMNIMGIECRTVNTPDRAPIDIKALWEKFYNEDIQNQIPHKASNDVMALYCDYEGDHTMPYTVVVGCPVDKVDQIPEGFVVKKINEGTFASYSAKGEHPQAVIETWQNIWQADLPRAYSADLEV